jgi:hypothetical protein
MFDNIFDTIVSKNIKNKSIENKLTLELYSY